MPEITSKALKKRVFKPVLYKRLTETTILRVLSPYIDKTKLTLDIGGNTGHMAFFQSNYSKKVISYEAVDVVVTQLKKIEEQKNNVEVRHLAVSNFCGEETFYIDHKRLSNSSFQNLVGGKEVKVQVVSLDSEGHENVGFIKIDVEGTELDVLNGAIEIIDRDRPNCMVEIYKPYAKDPLNSIFDFFFERNYKCFYYDHNVPEGLVQVLDTPDGVYAVETKHEAHDGDFLFEALK